MKSLEQVLLSSPFYRDDGRALLDLVEAKLRGDAASWLIEYIRPIEADLQAAVDSARITADQTRAAVASAKAEFDQAMAATRAGGINPPPEVAERRIKATHALTGAQQEASSAGHALQEVELRQRRLKEMVEALETARPPYPGEVQQIVKLALGRSGGLAGAVSGGPTATRRLRV